MSKTKQIRWCSISQAVCNQGEWGTLSVGEGKPITVTCDPCLLDEVSLTLQSVRDAMARVGVQKQKAPVAQKPIQTPLKSKPRLMVTPVEPENFDQDEPQEESGDEPQTETT